MNTPDPRAAKQISAKIARRVARAFAQYSMIRPGEKVLAALSGGKDSLTLLYSLKKVARSWEPAFTFDAVHIRSDFEGCQVHPKMPELVESWGIRLHIIDVAIRGRLAPGQNLNCYWCSTQRRMELLKYANANGYTSIALGHHMDDILETLLMNMSYKGEISTMMPVIQYDKFPQRVLRPLCFVKEREIIEFADVMGFAGQTVSCPFGTTSRRLEVRKALEILSARGDYVKEKLFESMAHIRLDYMPEQDPPA